MQTLDFIGTVQAKTTGFASELVIPGRDDLFLFPEDWPTQLAPGTLNVQINDDGFPMGFNSDGLKKLDDGKFRPVLVIPQRKIAGNPVTSDAEHLTRGFAQVWQTDLQVIGTDQETTCWMLRIIGSEVTSEIELVDQQDLRSRLNLADGAVVKITIWEEESNWMPPGPNEWIAEWCEAARNVEGGFGREKAMGYLIGEKFLNFLEVAEKDAEWRDAIPTFVTEIKCVFEAWKIAEFLATPRRLGALGHVANDEGHQMLREAMDESEKLEEDALHLMLFEWAKELLLGDGEQ